MGGVAPKESEKKEREKKREIKGGMGPKKEVFGIFLYAPRAHLRKGVLRSYYYYFVSLA